MDIIKSLEDINAVMTNSHFVYTSGKHGQVYINKDALYPHTKIASEVGNTIAQKYQNLDIEVVVGPAVGGTILSQWTAYYLSEIKGKEVLSAYTEKDKGTTASASETDQIFRRGYDKIVSGKKVLVVEDLTTTGISVQKVVKAIKEAKGDVLAVCVMVNRNPEGVNSKMLGVPFDFLGVLKAESFDANICPFCKEGRPINTDVGHGKKYLEKK